MSPAIFNFNGAPVRTTLENGEPWFVAADVCRCLDLTNTSSAVGRLDDDEKGSKEVDTLGGPQRLLVVNEQGVYQLVFASRSEKVRPFKRWLTHEVLPTLRRTGTYTVALPQTYAEALRALAAEVEQKETLALENAALRPKAEFFDAVAGSDDTVSMNDAVKLAKVGIGRNKVMQALRALGVLLGNNTPAQEYIDRGYFKVVESRWSHPKTGENHVTLSTRVFQRGIEFIRRKLSPEVAS